MTSGVTVDTHLKEAMDAFRQSVGHIRTSYRFFASHVPQKKQFRHGAKVRSGNFEFTNHGQADAMLVELGWAFFTRLDAAFDALKSRLDLNPKKTLEFLEDSKMFTDDEIIAFKRAREIRNILHHGDGDGHLLKNPLHIIKIDIGYEPQFNKMHMEQYFDLFNKAASVLTKGD